MKPETAPIAETILVVDDDVRVVELLQITLGGRGYQVLTAYDGEGTLKIARHRKLDCLVLDVRLPRKSGFEVLDTIRRDPSLTYLPVILISGDATTETRLQGLKLGADDYMTKPFSPRELIIKLRRILDRCHDLTLLQLKTEVLQDEVRRSRDTLMQMRSELSVSLNRMGGMLSQMIELNRSHSIERVLEGFVISTAANLDLDSIALCLPDGDGGLRPRVWRGVEERIASDLCLAVDGPLVRTCVTLGRPVRVDEFEGKPGAYEEVLKLSAAGIVLLVPVLSESGLRALLALGERNGRTTLGLIDFKLLEILGNSIVAALSNAEIFEKSQRCFIETTAGLITSLEERLPFISGHSTRVADTAVALGRFLRLPADELETLRYGALLHDLGQCEQYGELLSSNVVLSNADRRENRRAAAVQAERLLGPGRESVVGQIVRHYQEYWDGSGIPDGLREQEIPLGARIVALANAWDALTHERPHRSAYPPDEALGIVRQRAGKQFDPQLVPCLLRMVEDHVLEVASTR